MELQRLRDTLGQLQTENEHKAHLIAELNHTSRPKSGLSPTSPPVGWEGDGGRTPGEESFSRQSGERKSLRQRMTKAFSRWSGVCEGRGGVVMDGAALSWAGLRCHEATLLRSLTERNHLGAQLADIVHSWLLLQRMQRMSSVALNYAWHVVVLWLSCVVCDCHVVVM